MFVLALCVCVRARPNYYLHRLVSRLLLRLEYCGCFQQQSQFYRGEVKGRGGTVAAEVRTLPAVICVL